MTLEIQQATPQHARQIADIKRSVWQDESADEKHIASVLAQPDHISLIAFEDGQAVGFVDGFVTLSADSVRRWELDLLAVLPAYRGRGIATKLINENTKRGYKMLDAEVARGLVAVGNIGSEKAFAHANYQLEDAPYALYVSDASVTETLPRPADVYLLPVSTFNYRGIWLEGHLTEPSYRAAQTIRTRHNWDIAGAVIPMKETALIDAALEAGYSLVGQYRWWHYSGLQR